ncbi:MAG: HTTM domain-containing protein [Polyangiaceae bacterium]|nr:HTTM domain-containing protein [Polyangiaceae bacterium]
MKTRWERWVRFVGEREPGLVLGLFRILVGLIALGGMIENVAYGVVDMIWVDKRFGGAFSVDGNWLVSLLGGASRPVVWGLVVACMLGSAAITVGFGGRVAIFLTVQAYYALTRINGNAGGGYDALITNAMWLLFLGGASATLSLDSKIKHGRWWKDDVTVPAIARRLAIFQILLVYATTGLHKLSPVWTPAGGYSALYWVYQEPTWRRFDMAWTAKYYPLMQVATAVTWHWETSAFLMFLFYWYRWTPNRGGFLRRQANRFDLRRPFLAIGVMLHLGILATIAVGPFSYISLAYYVTFLTPDEARTLLDRVRTRLMSRSRPRAA